MLAETNSSVLARIAKVVSYFTVVVPIFMLAAKVALRCTHSFKIIDPEKKLGKDLLISRETIDKIQQLAPKILSHSPDIRDEIERIKGDEIFKVKEYPDLIFKMGSTSSLTQTCHNNRSLDNQQMIEERFKNMVNGKAICLAHQLGLLVIPAAQKFTFEIEGGGQCSLIVEKRMDIATNETAQRELYHTQADQLNATIVQLTDFILTSGFNDVTPRNIPIINEPPGFQGNRRIALIDHEHMYNGRAGLVGDYENGSCGLVRSVGSEEQIDLVIAEARRRGTYISGDLKTRRLEELRTATRLREFHQDKGIVTGREPIQVNIDELELDLTTEQTLDLVGASVTHTMREVTEAVINTINLGFQNSSEGASIQGKRHLILNTNHHLLLYNQLRTDDDTLDYEEQRWIHQIITALVNKGHLFALEQVNGHGYFIQA